MVGYDVQAAVDTEHHLIVAHVLNDGLDRTQLAPIGRAALDAIGSDQLTVLAGRRYYNSVQILDCEGTGVLPCVPQIDTTGRAKHGHFAQARLNLRCRS
ncbi:MAG: hypothetical protein ABW184_13350 [Sphingobium sp.]